MSKTEEYRYYKVQLLDIHFSEAFYMPRIANSIPKNINWRSPNIVITNDDQTENWLTIIKEPSY